MLDQYITVKDRVIVVGQYPSSGAWYCKELPSGDLKELDCLITDITVILNKHNHHQSGNKTIKEKDDTVRGLKP